ncbi:MAG: helix-turn-helix domain-containing protein [Candidatus Brocadiia bacterium]
MGRFGEFFRHKRMALGLSLRQFCLQHGLDPGNISKLERGRLAPPQHEKLEEYARLLGIPQGSDDWYRFFDLAAAEAGRVPQDILSDEQVVEKLPLLFRTLRGEPVPDEQLDELVKTLKRS